MGIESETPTNFMQIIPNSNMTSGAAVLQLGGHYLWVDGGNNLRIFSGGVSSELANSLEENSGAVVGDQS